MLCCQEHTCGANVHRIFFPFGALTVRLLSFKGLVWVHAGTQLTAYAIAISGMGIGVWLAVEEGAVSRAKLAFPPSFLHFPDQGVLWSHLMLTCLSSLVDGKRPSYPRPHDHRPSLLPTHPRSNSSHDLSQISAADTILYCSRLVWSSTHSIGSNQRRSWIAAVRQHRQRRDSVRSHCWSTLPILRRRRCDFGSARPRTASRRDR